jgi:hypothetical protein
MQTFVIYMLKENNNLYIMSELEDLTKILVYTATLFFVFVILYNAYIYLTERIIMVEEPVFIVKEGFDAAAFKSASGSQINQGVRGKSKYISEQKSKAKKKTEEDKKKGISSPVEKSALTQTDNTGLVPGENHGGEGFQGNQNCLSIAECQTMQTANDNAKLLTTLSQKVDQLSQNVNNMQAAQLSNAKSKGVNAAKKASATIPNSGLTNGIKSQAQNSVAKNS